MRPDFPSFNLPFWIDGTEARKLADAARTWFSRLGVWAELPLSQSDPLSCTERVLVLLAWQRGIERVAGETDRSYRLRVAHAYANGRDSGQVEGWKRIFQRLELGTPELEERVPGQDWDVIDVLVPDEEMGPNQSVIEWIVDEYGRTCRRYRIVSRIPASMAVGCGRLDSGQDTRLTSIQTRATALMGASGYFGTAQASHHVRLLLRAAPVKPACCLFENVQSSCSVTLKKIPCAVCSAGTLSFESHSEIQEAS